MVFTHAVYIQTVKKRRGFCTLVLFICSFIGEASSGQSVVDYKCKKHRMTHDAFYVISGTLIIIVLEVYSNTVYISRFKYYSVVLMLGWEYHSIQQGLYKL